MGDQLNKWIILPVAVPGAGRARTMLILEDLFGFPRIRAPISGSGETSSDEDLSSYVGTMLQTNPVVIADRHNHLIRDRAVFKTVCVGIDQRPLLLALNWSFSSLSMAKTHAICMGRVQQSLPNASETLWRFLRDYEPLQSGEVDACINLPLTQPFDATLISVIRHVADLLGLECPDELSIRRAESSVMQHQSYSRDIVQLSGSDAAQSTSLAFESPLSEPDRDVAEHSEESQLDPRDNDVDESTALAINLLGVSRGEKPHITSRSFSLTGGLLLTSWRVKKTTTETIFQSPPTLSHSLWARGFWTQQCVDATPSGSQISHKVALRGYDKIFRIDETFWSTCESLKSYTTGPYHVSPKLDGSLIMVAAVTHQRLVVSSKHALGHRPNRPPTHADVGETWLLDQLAKVGKLPADLATVLWQNNWTLMCELLDNAFEERVFAVPEGKAGLHLHGINSRTIAFRTVDPSLVREFADEWGFHTVEHASFESFSQVEYFMMQCDAGKELWGGMHSLGLVVRATVCSLSGMRNAADTSPAVPYAPPYEIGTPFFFAIPAGPPYPLWKCYYEITRASLSQNSLVLSEQFLQSEDSYKAIAYDSWLHDRIRSDPEVVKLLSQRRGFISLRTQFLEWMESAEGHDAANDAQDRIADLQVYDPDKPLKKPMIGKVYNWLIIPVGLPGCGKTAISRALEILFGATRVDYNAFGGTSSKRAKSRFFEFIEQACRIHKIVIVDGPCHRAGRRRKLKDTVCLRVQIKPMILALDWSRSGANIAMAERVCSIRLARRDSTSTSVTDHTVRRISAEYEPLRELDANCSIPMQYEEGLEESCARAAGALARLLGVQPPSQSAIINAAKAGSENILPLNRGIRDDTTQFCHFAFALEMDSRELLTRSFLEYQPSEHSLRHIWQDLPSRSPHLVYARPRCTVIHPKMAVLPTSESNALLQRCAALPTRTDFRLILKNVFFNHRIVAASVHLSDPENGNDDAAQFLHSLPELIKSQLHVVLARQTPFVAPQEAAALLEALHCGDQSVGVIQLGGAIAIGATLQGFD